MAASIPSYRFSGMGPLARFYPARHIGLKALAAPVDKNRTGNATNRNTSNDMSSEWISLGRASYRQGVCSIGAS